MEMKEVTLKSVSVYCYELKSGEKSSIKMCCRPDDRCVTLEIPRTDENFFALINMGVDFHAYGDSYKLCAGIDNITEVVF